MIYFSLLLVFIGFIVGLGSVLVIDLLGFLAIKSSYWTLTTIRAHKVTKVLIWLGIIFLSLGLYLFYLQFSSSDFIYIHLISFIILIINGIFLSFVVSPYLIKREKENKESEILEKSWQNKITISFIISFIIWWGNLVLFLLFLVSKLTID